MTPPTVASTQASSRFTHAKRVVSTRQCDTTVLLDVNGGLYYTLNEVGGRIWDLVGEQASVAEIVERLAGEFDVATERLVADGLDVIKTLLEAGLVERVP